MTDGKGLLFVVCNRVSCSDGVGFPASEQATFLGTKGEGGEEGGSRQRWMGKKEGRRTEGEKQERLKSADRQK